MIPPAYVLSIYNLFASIFPGYGFHPGIDSAEQRGVLVAEDDIKAFGKKLIRGTTWVLDKKYIEPDYLIDIYFARDPVSFPFYESLARFGKSYSLGPGLMVVRAIAEEDGLSGFYYMEIWRKLFMYGSVTRRKMQQESVPV
ncbi:MAG: hypothetical protein ABIJ52_02835 [Pseudomonadota bacterium]